MVAAEKNYANEVKRLIEKGANINTQTWDGVTPIMYAIQNENTEIVTYLLKKGADPNQIPLNEIPPLVAAIKTENMDIAETLIRNGAVVNKGDKNGITPLMYAVAFNNYTLSDMLLYYDAWPNMQDTEGNSALMYAALYAFPDLMELLLQYDANPNLADKKKFTPLYAAAQQGNINIVKLLHQHGAKIKSPTKYGHTPLFAAIENQHYAIVEYLLAYIDLEKDLAQKERSLLNLALHHKNDSIIQLLKARGLTSERYPKINEYFIGADILFTKDDAFAGLSAGFCDIEYNLNAKLSYSHRIGAFPALDKVSDTDYYQYWERRSLYYAAVGRYFKIINTPQQSFSVNPFIGYTLSLGNYRGTYKRPDILYLFTPGLETLYMKNNWGISFSYRYIDLKTHALNDHWFNIGVCYSFSSATSTKNSKKIIWYL